MMRIIIGVGLFGHAANLIILIAGGLYDGDIPIISELGKNYIDPVPAALILTAIVIGFAAVSYTHLDVYKRQQLIMYFKNQIKTK